MTIKPEGPSNVTPLPTKDMADGATYGDLKELLRMARCALLDANEEITELKKCVEFWHKQFSDKCGTPEQAMEEMAQINPESIIEP